MLDNDLAKFYQTNTKSLNQAVRRNPERFPSDFRFQISQKEQTSIAGQANGLHKNHGGRRYRPFAFTQEGISMLSGVLNSDRAVQVNILIMRAFVQLRKVSESDLNLVKRFDQLESKFNEQHQIFLQVIQRPVEEKVQETKPKKSKSSMNLILIKKNYVAKIQCINQEVSKYFGLSISALETPSRIRKFLIPRQIATYLIRLHTPLTLNEIGSLFGGQDHTTILNTVKKVSRALKTDELIRDAVETVESLLSG